MGDSSPYSSPALDFDHLENTLRDVLQRKFFYDPGTFSSTEGGLCHSDILRICVEDEIVLSEAEIQMTNSVGCLLKKTIFDIFQIGPFRKVYSLRATKGRMKITCWKILVRNFVERRLKHTELSVLKMEAIHHHLKESCPELQFCNEGLLDREIGKNIKEVLACQKIKKARGWCVEFIMEEHQLKESLTTRKKRKMSEEMTSKALDNSVTETSMGFCSIKKCPRKRKRQKDNQWQPSPFSSSSSQVNLSSQLDLSSSLLSSPPSSPSPSLMKISSASHGGSEFFVNVASELRKTRRVTQHHSPFSSEEKKVPRCKPAGTKGSCSAASCQFSPPQSLPQLDNLSEEDRKELVLNLFPWFGGRFLGGTGHTKDSVIPGKGVHGESILAFDGRVRDLGGFLSLDETSHILCHSTTALAQTVIVPNVLRKKLINILERVPGWTSKIDFSRVVVEFYCRTTSQARHVDESQVRRIAVVDIGGSGCLQFWGPDRGNFCEELTGSYLWENLDVHRTPHCGVVGKTEQGRLVLIFREYSMPLQSSSVLTTNKTPAEVRSRIFANALFSQALQCEFTKRNLSLETLKTKSFSEILDILYDFVAISSEVLHPGGYAALQKCYGMAPSQSSIFAYLSEDELLANFTGICLGKPLPSSQEFLVQYGNRGVMWFAGFHTTQYQAIHFKKGEGLISVLISDPQSDDRGSEFLECPQDLFFDSGTGTDFVKILSKSSFRGSQKKKQWKNFASWNGCCFVVALNRRDQQRFAELNQVVTHQIFLYLRQKNLNCIGVKVLRYRATKQFLVLRTSRCCNMKAKEKE